MTKSALATLVLATLALGACDSRTAWVKESAPAGQLDYDQQECRRSAGSYGYIERGASYTANTERNASNSSVSEEYRRCMEQRGWRRERGPASSARGT